MRCVRLAFVLLILLPLLIIISACAPAGDGAAAGTRAALPGGDECADVWRVSVVGPGGEEVRSLTETELASETTGLFAYVYSTINNWPSPRFYVAEGYKAEDLLKAAGLYETAQTVTFRGEDGYEVSLTREQLLAAQYSYPHPGESLDGATPVYPILAFRWREGADDMDSLREDRPSLIIGQRNPFEHTNPAFVVGVTEIIVSGEPCQVWPMASTFPLPGSIAEGETVKLQHPDFGLVKLYYTLDGSEPTALSAMYNPSTYQPELNVPIPITGQTLIKVLVSGYGKLDSEIAVFEFIIPAT